MTSPKLGPCWDRGQIPTTSSTGVTSGRLSLHYTGLAIWATLRLWRHWLLMELVLIKVVGGLTGLHFTMHAGEVIKRWCSTWRRRSGAALVSSHYNYLCIVIVSPYHYGIWIIYMYCVAISIVSVISRSIIIICDVVVVALVSSRCVCEVFIPWIQRKV